MLFYDEGGSATREGPLQQGDILVNIPFVAVSAAALTVVTPSQSEPQTFDATLGVALSPGTFVVAEVESGVGILLNQSCDVTGDSGRTKPVIVARVRPLAEHTDANLKTFGEKAPLARTKLVRALANPGQNPNMFYLPPASFGNFCLPPSYVDLLDTVTLAPSDAVAIRALRRARLRADALRALQERLAYLFGRYGADDALYFTDEEAAAAQSHAVALAEERRKLAATEAAKDARRAVLGGGGGAG